MTFTYYCHSALEKRLKDANYLESHGSNHFQKQTAYGFYSIEDDHKPFLALGETSSLGDQSDGLLVRASYQPIVVLVVMCSLFLSRCPSGPPHHLSLPSCLAHTG